jgi:hypothetical protein
MVATLEPRTYLEGWYPGFGEELNFRRLPRDMQRFLSDAVDEDPDFLPEYLVPALQSKDPYGQIFTDMALGLSALDLAEAGLGDFEQNLDGLGKSFFKKIGKTLKKSLNPVQAIKSAVGFTKREIKKEVKATEKVFRKYGPIILTVAGAALAPFTGGASMAAASVLIAAQKAYQVHAQAAKAKKEARAEAGQLQAQADAQNAQTEQQVDQFYSQNQDWFVTQLGVTPDKWGQLTLQQKIDLINSGTTGQVPSGAATTPPPDVGPSAPPQAMTQGPVTTPSIYGGGAPPSGGAAPAGPQMPPDASGSGGDWGNIMPGGSSPSGGQPGQQQQQPQVAQSSMFGDMSGMILPAALVAAAVIFTQGKGGGGSRRRSRRNPSRRRRW